MDLSAWWGDVSGRGGGGAVAAAAAPTLLFRLSVTPCHPAASSIASSPPPTTSSRRSSLRRGRRLGSGVGHGAHPVQDGSGEQAIGGQDAARHHVEAAAGRVHHLATRLRHEE